MFEKIPSERPSTPLLDQIDSPQDLKKLEISQLSELADQLRLYLLYAVGQTGGHFGAGLGVVELTVALHYVFNAPKDRLVWDVGHQAYPHKILTGRRDEILTIRQKGGLAAFPNRHESEFDQFGVGHSSTSISAVLGMMVADRIKNENQYHVAVIGDGAMTAGMAFEALNHAGHIDDNILVILNDNNMSISNNVGGLSSYFARMWASKPYNFIRTGSKRVFSKIPPALKAIHRAEEYMKGMVSPGTLFEEIGFNYIGLIDGHNASGLVEILQNIKTLRGPQLLHIVTQKGKGYSESEKDPFGMHAMSKIEANSANSKNFYTDQHVLSYSEVFGSWLCDTAEKDSLAVGITPAMGEGSGMRKFAEKFPGRFHDVAIAEQHAVTFAAGLACEGARPIVAIYSTFLQRAYDQLIHDVALQNLNVLFAIDRAGLVGEDGPTHAGSFDISFLRCIPNLIIMTPSDESETYRALSTGYEFNGPAAVRYPRGKGIGIPIDKGMRPLEVGKGLIRQDGNTIAIFAFGSMVKAALEAAEKLGATLVDMRFVKPLDEELISKLAANHQLVVTVEESAVMGGAGSAVNEFLTQLSTPIQTLNLGLPDKFLEHGKPSEMLDEINLNCEGIIQAIKNKQNECEL